MTSLPLLAALALCVAGCGAEPVRYAVPDVTTDERIRVSVRSIEIREVSLPAYARGEEIWRETAEGALVADPATLWADDPARGVTQELTRHLTALTRARAAAEPWPFLDAAEARLEVRLDTMVAGSDGQFRLSGQYFTASNSGTRDQAGVFDLTAPIAAPGAAPDIARARAEAVRALARQIAKTGL